MKKSLITPNGKYYVGMLCMSVAVAAYASMRIVSEIIYEVVDSKETIDVKL